METRVAVMGIIVENMDSVELLNSLLHEFGEFINRAHGDTLSTPRYQHCVDSD